MISMFEKHIFMPSIHALHNFRDLGLHVHMSLLSVLCYQLYLLMGFVKPAILLGSKPRPRMIHGPAAVSFCPTGISIRYACQPMDVLQIFPASINWLYEILSCKMSWWKAMPRRCLWRKAAPNPLNCYKQPASGPTRWAIGSEFPGCTGGVVLFLKRPFCVSPVQKLQLLDTETHTHKHAHTHTQIWIDQLHWRPRVDFFWMPGTKSSPSTGHSEFGTAGGVGMQKRWWKAKVTKCQMLQDVNVEVDYPAICTCWWSCADL